MRNLNFVILYIVFFLNRMVKGELIYKNGDEYKGEIVAGRLEGKGIYKFKNGSVYEG